MKDKDHSAVHSASKGLPLSAILLCLLASGSASLGLEVVWSRLLVLVFGSTSLAISTTLVATMLGFGLGGLIGGRLAGRVANGVRAYGWMELAVGAYALLVPNLLRFVPAADAFLVGALGAGAAPFVRFTLSLSLLLLPTMAMGATLPLLVGALARSDATVGARTGLLYGINTVGAVLGVLGATFVGFPALGLRGTNTAAAVLDLLAGLVAVFVLAPRLAGREREPVPTLAAPAAGVSGARARTILVAYALVGATALAYEVGWTRALAMIVGSSTYAFATMLAGFLAGIALGSLLVHRVLDRLRDPTSVFGLGVALLGVAAYVVSELLDELPDFFLHVFETVGISGDNLVWLGFIVSFVVLLAPTLILGALFPLCVRTLVAAHVEKGRAVGAVYFANTLGSATGAFVMGFILIPSVGLQRSLSGVIALDLALGAGLILLASARRGAKTIGITALALAACALVKPPSWDVDALSRGVYYRSSSRLDFGLPKVPMPGATEDEILFYREGRNATISVHRTEGGLGEGGVSLRINGKTDASLADMSTQILSGHLPLLFGDAAERVLVIGLASGVTTGAVTLHEPTRIDVCEIEEAVVEASTFFDDVNHRPLQDPRVVLHLEDGRSFLRASKEQWDVVISEPSNPWMAGCANLFTREFFELARARIAPGGRLLQWVQLYGMEPQGVRAILAALHESFPHVHGFLFDQESNDLLLLASDSELTLADLPHLEELPSRVRRDLARVRVLSTADLWSLVALCPEDLSALAAEAQHVNTDDNLFVELSAPLRLYDDTPETSLLLRARSSGAGGIPGMLDEVEPELLTELAVSYLERRGATELGDEIHAALRRRADEAGDALYMAVRILVLGGSGRDAGRLLNDAVRLGPERFLARYQRAWFANQRKLYTEALADLDVALRLRPEHAETAHQRSKALATLGRLAEARAATDALIAGPLLETEPRLLAEAALLDANAGELERACARMRRYLGLEPYEPREWKLLAAWEAELGNAAEAREAGSNAELAHANLVRQFHWIARWHEDYGTREEALAALAVARSLAPEDAGILADIERLGG